MSQVNAPMTYGDYLRVDDLLSLQHPVGDSAYCDATGETFFIVAHQSTELWLKSMILELEALDATLVAREPLGGTPMQHLRRALAGAGMLVANVSALRSLDRENFLSFRDHLGTASGAQSAQFARLRELIGLGSSEGGPIEKHLREWRSGSKNLLDRDKPRGNHNGTSRMPVDRGPVGAGHLHTSATNQCQGNHRAPSNSGMEDSNHDAEEWQPQGEYRCFLETLLDLSSAIWLWGIQHLDVTQRMIGGRKGTGGTSGAHYLAGRLLERPFPTLMDALETKRVATGSNDAHEAYEERTRDGIRYA